MIAADSREIPLADKCVHCCITSPPYWGLRDYGLPGQLGLERTPQLYLAEMRKVFREVWRVLRDDGTAWVNMGDSYCGPNGRSGGGFYDSSTLDLGRGTDLARNAAIEKVWGRLKPKDLCGIPWRLAFALQEDGWYLRSDIIWAKPNPMPESVTDRPTKSHEYVFLLAKQGQYFYDAEAVKENITGNAHARGDGLNPKALEHNATRIARAREDHKSNPTLERNGIRPRQNDSFSAAVNGLVGSRNLRSVWHIATQPYSGAHFATFPEKLVEPCIRAGTSERGVCCQCGAPWERVTLASGGTIGKSWHDHGANEAQGQSQSHPDFNRSFKTYRVDTIGWRPTCLCPGQHGKTRRAIVLDPFGGSGTVGRVATRLGRQSILLDIGYRDKYAPLAVERNSRVQMELI